jgi:DNA-binding IclR family transcriptional regulator
LGGRRGGHLRIGFRFLEFGEHARQRKQGYRLAREKVEALADETAERVQFLVEENGRAVYVHRALGEHAVRTDPGIGSRIPLHATAGGKAILAQLPESRVDEIIERRGLAALTPHTITSREQLFEEFERTRDRGYSINDQENIEGLRALGVPIRRKNGLVLGALSVSGPTHRMKGEWFNRELADLLLGTANEIELNVQHS